MHQKKVFKSLEMLFIAMQMWYTFDANLDVYKTFLLAIMLNFNSL